MIMKYQAIRGQSHSPKEGWGGGGGGGGGGAKAIPPTYLFKWGLVQRIIILHI